MRDPEVSQPKTNKKKKKPFGIQQWSTRMNRWTHGSWYATEKARDAAYDDLVKKHKQFLAGWSVGTLSRKIGETRLRKIER
jgi:hypothetical protein